MEEEIWKPVKGYEDFYEVSNIGRIRTIGRESIGKDGRKVYIRPRIRKSSIDYHGYCYVKITKNGKQKNLRVHRAVIEAFVPNPLNKPFVDHINTIKSDNRVENLRWVTASENTQNPITLQRIKDACTPEQIGKQIRTKKERGIWKGIHVYQYTTDGCFVAEYNTILDAARKISNKPRQISRNIRNAIDKPRRSAYGYIWRSKRIEPSS